ncbi:putative UDP-glucuronate:xylan alpha-glucuronosyltransferase 5 [Andrographis paniculata]|uniref:putative UDP-glucuronate:xylan alpha-glucuronosyltransferase 5 n=1 Tax=Andrographis paniculata TaxID=175694 RepID=UPI0021E8BD5F|nr:putative UDP-glucuronate:xylan alpha-glucuronosyltransferase 5 [Andrographis paniculata]
MHDQNATKTIFHTEENIVNVHFTRVQNNIKWSDIYPEWIDENAPPNCPSLPMPRFEEYRDLDVVVARVPDGGGARDVGRLQVNLVVANLLVRSGRKLGFGVFLGKIDGAMWEIFRCDDLFWSGDDNGGNVFVYKPNLELLREKVVMPVGSCQVAPPLPQYERSSAGDRREAYVSVLHSSESYVCGAIVLAQSIIQSNSTKDLILLADDHISPAAIDGLKSAGWKVRRIERIQSPHAKQGSYNEWNYSKLRIWQLTDYHKLIFIDSDLIAAGNLDGLFNYPPLSAAGNDGHIFNSGVMVISPSECAFDALMDRRFAVGSYNGGDQGFLNEMFTWWHRLPGKANRLKFFGSTGGGGRRIGEDAAAIHYLGLKPWMCYKDYDCNWDTASYRVFASDSANERWWRVYETMAAELRPYCGLTAAMEARIGKYRKKAREEKFPDGHWRIKVRDPRRRRRSTADNKLASAS